MANPSKPASEADQRGKSRIVSRRYGRDKDDATPGKLSAREDIFWVCRTWWRWYKKMKEFFGDRARGMEGNEEKAVKQQSRDTR
jgi:hypothetical protein